MSNFSFIDKKNIKNSSFILDEKESHHIISVLRLKENSNLILTDGQGKVYHAVIIEFNKDARKIVVSHTQTHSEIENKQSKSATKKSANKKLKSVNQNTEKSTLGDLDVLAELKLKMDKEK